MLTPREARLKARSAAPIVGDARAVGWTALARLPDDYGDGGVLGAVSLPADGVADGSGFG
jgi:hypothetical protein